MHSKEELIEALNTVMKGSTGDAEHTQLYFLYKQYGRFKQFTVHFLNTLTFEIAFAKDYFGSGLNLLIQLQKGNKRKLPNDVSMNFITNSWMNLIDQFEYTQSQAYELCVLSVLKDRLNSGDVFVKNSRKLIAPHFLMHSKLPLYLLLESPQHGYKEEVNILSYHFSNRLLQLLWYFAQRIGVHQKVWDNLFLFQESHFKIAY